MSGDRAADLKAAPPWRADPRRHADAGGLARQEATPDDARPACRPPLADRAHERLAESDAADRHPPRPQGRQLPRLPPAGDDRRPDEVVLRQAPTPIEIASERARTPSTSSLCRRFRTWTRSSPRASGGGPAQDEAAGRLHRASDDPHAARLPTLRTRGRLARRGAVDRTPPRRPAGGPAVAGPTHTSWSTRYRRAVACRATSARSARCGRATDLRTEKFRSLNGLCANLGCSGRDSRENRRSAR
jgi:hypothetical protein